MKLGWLVLPTIAAGCAVATSAAVAGRSGALISISLVAAVPLIVLAYSLGRPASRPRPPEREPPPEGWQTFTDIAIELGWAKVSRRHFDHRPRRVLQRVTAAALETRAGVDFFSPRDRERAIALIGADLWPLVDPQRKPSTDSRAPGLDPATIDRLLTRLERL
jgi:hypothetical protein